MKLKFKRRRKFRIKTQYLGQLKKKTPREGIQGVDSLSNPFVNCARAGHEFKSKAF